MPVRHLLVWLAAGVACWSTIAVAAFAAPQALLALGALVVLPWLRHPRAIAESGAAESMLLRAPSVDAMSGQVAGPVTGRDRELVAQSA